MTATQVETTILRELRLEDFRQAQLAKKKSATAYGRRRADLSNGLQPDHYPDGTAEDVM
jgi:hypothetical protein